MPIKTRETLRVNATRIFSPSDERRNLGVINKAIKELRERDFLVFNIIVSKNDKILANITENYKEFEGISKESVETIDIDEEKLFFNIEENKYLDISFGAFHLIRTYSQKERKVKIKKILGAWKGYIKLDKFKNGNSSYYLYIDHIYGE